MQPSPSSLRQLDEQGRGWLSQEQTAVALKEVNSKLTGAEREFLFRVGRLGYRLSVSLHFSSLHFMSFRFTSLHFSHWCPMVLQPRDLEESVSDPSCSRFLAYLKKLHVDARDIVKKGGGGPSE